MASTSFPQGREVRRTLLLTFTCLAWSWLSASVAVAQAECTAASSLKVTERKNDPPGGPIWYWTLAITNKKCTPSAGSYEYELVYTGEDGKTHREEQSGWNWDTADSQNGNTRTNARLPQGASDPKLEKITVTGCSCN